jgi:hypothetical protein
MDGSSDLRPLETNCNGRAFQAAFMPFIIQPTLFPVSNLWKPTFCGAPDALPTPFIMRADSSSTNSMSVWKIPVIHLIPAGAEAMTISRRPGFDVDAADKAVCLVYVVTIL